MIGNDFRSKMSVTHKPSNISQDKRIGRRRKVGLLVNQASGGKLGQMLPRIGFRKFALMVIVTMTFWVVLSAYVNNDIASLKHSRISGSHQT